MGFVTYATHLIPKILRFKLAYWGLAKPPLPDNFTLTVTAACQSLCKTCNIGLLHRQHPERVRDELTLEEIEKIFKSIGKVYFFNITGGEPFLRRDLPQIIELACKHLRPQVVHTPTNALTPELIERRMREIMTIIKKYNPKIDFTIKPSFDAVGKKHDEIRGVKGNWEKLLETIDRLKKLKKEFPNLHVGAGTVISKWSIGHLKETAEYVEKLKLDSYINEVAEERTEMSNVESGITPSWKAYQDSMVYFKNKIKKQMKNLPPLDRLVMAFRLVYYDIATNILKERRQVIPCYAGIANCQISSYGNVWTCATLAGSNDMGNLRDFDYDFKKLWYGQQAKKARKYIKDKNCACPLANVYLSNIMVHPPSALKVAWTYIKGVAGWHTLEKEPEMPHYEGKGLPPTPDAEHMSGPKEPGGLTLPVIQH